MVEPADIVKYYDSNKQKYTQVRVKAIYIAFSDDAAEQHEQGKEAADRSGSQGKSDQTAGRAQGRGGFRKAGEGELRRRDFAGEGRRFRHAARSDNIPDAFRAAVFALKKGEVTEPLKQPNGFYLLRAEEVTVRPLSEVRDEIYNELKNARSNQWLRGMDEEPRYRS